MKFITKLLCGTAALGALVGLYYGDDIYDKRKSQQKAQSSVAMHFENKECVRFLIQNANGTFIFERKNFESPWQMISPKNVMANQDAVNSALVLLRNIAVQRELSKDSNEQNDYGLNFPTLRFEVTYKDNRTKTLTVGSDLSDNKNSAFHLPSAYAEVSERSNILIIDNSSFASFHENDFSHFRTKNVAGFKSARVANLYLNSQNENIEISQNGNEWIITSPKATSADHKFILQYLQTIQNLSADQIIEPPVQPVLKLHGINIENPTATLLVTDANGKSLQEFYFYLAKSGVFVNMPDGAFARIEMDQWTELVPKFKHFRNRSVMLGSNAKCSPELEVLTADDVLDNVSSVDLQKFGFKRPVRKLPCGMNQKNTDALGKGLQILVGNRVPLDEKNVYVKRSDSDTVYIVDAESISRLAQQDSL